MGTTNSQIISHKTHEKPFWGENKMSAIGWPLYVKPWCKGTLEKKLKVTGCYTSSRGTDFISSPKSFVMTLDHTHEATVSSAPLRCRFEQAVDAIADSRTKKDCAATRVPPMPFFRKFPRRHGIKISSEDGRINYHQWCGGGKAKKFGASLCI